MIRNALRNFRRVFFALKCKALCGICIELLFPSTFFSAIFINRKTVNAALAGIARQAVRRHSIYEIGGKL